MPSVLWTDLGEWMAVEKNGDRTILMAQNLIREAFKRLSGLNLNEDGLIRQRLEAISRLLTLSPAILHAVIEAMEIEVTVGKYSY